MRKPIKDLRQAFKRRELPTEGGFAKLTLEDFVLCCLESSNAVACKTYNECDQLLADLDGRTHKVGWNYETLLAQIIPELRNAHNTGERYRRGVAAIMIHSISVHVYSDSRRPSHKGARS